MRVLCFSDLHIPKWEDYLRMDDRYIDWGGLTKIKPLITQSNPDVVVATGDLVYPTDLPNYYEILENVFGSDIPVVTTLGNHEFWGRSFEETIQVLADAGAKHPNSNIHCLDLCRAYDTPDTVFVGGMLFFDGSMRWLESQQLYPLNGWNDCYITDLVDYKKVCDRYKSEIKENVSMWSTGKHTILCTHHLPHSALNMHEPSPYSFYSGVDNLLAELSPDTTKSNVSISGHTHRRCVGKTLEGWLCVNVGKSVDDYDINYFCLEV